MATSYEVNRQKEKTPVSELDPAERAKTFDEVALGYTEEEAVAEARREQGKTQKQLAERALVDQAVVSRVERGRANITSDLLADVACALGMCVEVTLAPAAVYNGEPDEGRSGL